MGTVFERALDAHMHWQDVADRVARLLRGPFESRDTARAATASNRRWCFIGDPRRG